VIEVAPPGIEPGLS